MREVIIVIFAVTAAVFDLKTHRIPNRLVIGMFGVWLILSAFEAMHGVDLALSRIVDSALGAAVGGGIFLAVYFICRDGLGAGDVKFMTAAGLYLGMASVLPAVLYGSILAALTGIVLLLLKKIKRKDKIPLAPFLLAGILITMIIPWVF